MRICTVALALLFFIQFEHSSTKPMASDSDFLKNIKKRLHDYQEKQKTAGAKHNIANLNTLKNNVSLPEIQMPPITVVIVKDKKALEKYQREGNQASTMGPVNIIMSRSSDAPKKA